MDIVHFGTYSTGEGYPRNNVVSAALRHAGCRVVECHREAWGDAPSRAAALTGRTAAIKTAVKLAAAWVALAWKYLVKTPPHDLLIVGYPGHLDVFPARLLAALRGKPVVLDAFLSVYEAAVEDRGLLAPSSIKAKALKFIDEAGCRAADAVLLDTQAHIDYYSRNFKTRPEKFIRVFVGAEEDRFRPPAPPPEVNAGEVLFFGSFLPLHGAEVIIEAAKLLEDEEDIAFTLIGDGPRWGLCKEMADESHTRITMEKRWMDYPALADRIARSEICLGIFSNGPKASRVIPCKVFNVLAMGKPLVTADTPAAREALTHGESAWLVKPGDPEALAGAIKKLHEDKKLREKIASGGMKVFKSRLDRRAIGKELAEELARRFQKKRAV